MASLAGVRRPATKKDTLNTYCERKSKECSACHNLTCLKQLQRKMLSLKGLIGGGTKLHENN